MLKSLMVKNVNGHPRRGFYLLPNLCTTAALMASFSAILLALNHEWPKACMAIFLAMVFDGFDGHVARMTHTESKFGEEYDSLADVISFGMAPALIIYLWALKDLSGISTLAGRLGWFASFFYLACTALRLARFNVSIGSVDKRFFIGLPSPSAAALVVGFVWVGDSFGLKGNQLNWIALLITVYAGLMMVSNTLFYSFKSLGTGKLKFFSLVGMIFFAGLLLSDPPRVLFFTAVLYGFSGPIHWIIRRKRRNQSIFPDFRG